jgi:hypothetical protein
LNETAKTLHDLFASEWDYQLEQYPTWASRLGDRRWNDRWDDQSLDVINGRYSHNVEVLARLGKSTATSFRLPTGSITISL